jgi:hypothetical protein
MEQTEILRHHLWLQYKEQISASHHDAAIDTEGYQPEEGNR